MLFQVVKLDGDWWGVFIVNPKDDKDRYLVSDTFDKKNYADGFAAEFNRIATAAKV